MKIIRNKYLPLPGYKVFNFLGFYFVKPNVKLSDVDLNHERIHSQQILEIMVAAAIPSLMLTLFVNLFAVMLLWIFSYYIWYAVEFLINWAAKRDRKEAYRAISFEREAYENQENLNFLSKREMFNFLKYRK